MVEELIHSPLVGETTSCGGFGLDGVCGDIVQGHLSQTRNSDSSSRQCWVGERSSEGEGLKVIMAKESMPLYLGSFFKASEVLQVCYGALR